VCVREGEGTSEYGTHDITIVGARAKYGVAMLQPHMCNDMSWPWQGMMRDYRTSP